ncbi:hypothetical protein IWGMT90018_23880 [Mycobacterium kiyosense]|nr:hypothetical protein IWGMT90018_23880 [Mycobacterium kiyosense]
MFEDFAGRVARDVPHDELAGQLVGTEAFGTEGAEFFERQRVTGVRGDDGDDRFAVVGVLAGDHRDIGDCRVRGEFVFHFDGVDVASTGDDHVLEAVDQGDVTVGVDRGDVAGVQPAVADGLGGGLRIAPVPLHDGLAAQNELARATGADVIAVRVDDPGLGVEQRMSPAGIRALADLLGAAVDAARAALGLPACLNQLEVWQRFERFLHR